MRNNQVTIGDIADKLKISKTTVSRVLSGTGRISAETREKVMACVKSMDYRPNLLAKGLATAKTFNIGVVIPGDAAQTDMPYFHNCLAGISESANNLNYDVLVSVSSGQKLEALERVVKNNKVDGVILTRLLENDKRVNLLQQYGMPFLVIGSSQNPDITQVDSCNMEACRDFTLELTKRCAKRFVFICGNQDIVVNQLRLAGFLNAMKEAGLSEKSYKVFTDVNNGDQVRSCLEQVKDQKDFCIVCADDFLCAHALTWIQDTGLQVPSEVQIGSFYDSSLLEQHKPSVSAIEISASNIGSKSAEVLVAQLSGGELEKKTYVNYEFHFRNSTCSN